MFRSDHFHKLARSAYPMDSQMLKSFRRLSALLIACLWLVGSMAQAAWVPVTGEGGRGNESFRTYIDPQSVVRKGEHVTLRVLMNYRERTEEGIASALGVSEFDCLNDRMRSRSVTAYGEPDGKGRVIREFKSVGAWSVVQPASSSEALLESACDFYPQWWSE
jgi:hypothetical protein